MSGFLPRLADALARLSARWVPDAFSIAALLTLLALGLGLTVGGASPAQCALAWGDGVWALLSFAMQIALVIFAGYVLAVAPPVARALERPRPRAPRAALGGGVDGLPLDGPLLAELGHGPHRLGHARADDRPRPPRHRLPAARGGGLPRHGHDLARRPIGLGAAPLRDAGQLHDPGRPAGRTRPPVADDLHGGEPRADAGRRAGSDRLRGAPPPAARAHARGLARDARRARDVRAAGSPERADAGRAPGARPLAQPRARPPRPRPTSCCRRGRGPSPRPSTA